MDQRIFDQLEMLERGARIPSRPHQDDHYVQEETYPADGGYGHSAAYRVQYHQRNEEQPDPAMMPDSFDQQLLHQPSNNVSRQDRKLLVRPDEGQQARSYDTSRDDDIATNSPRQSLSAYAFDSDRTLPSSTSQLEERLPSSPAFNVSQRRSYGFDQNRDTAQSSVDRLQIRSVARSQHFAPAQIIPDDQGFHTTNRPSQRRANQDRVSIQRSTKPSGSLPTAPIVQGITLVSTHDLPDRFRSMFPFPLFNAVQSKSFEVVYKTNDNFVLSAPTGSGKTAVLELAICRLINGFADGNYKIVYQAPTKSLCSERQRDWQAKFGPLGLQCAELTGDTDGAQLRSVQHASIIITTPEKWDSMTRKWKDHQKLMEMVKLFLIDEVHILKESRGATLEAVVSRMKSVGSNVRFVALSATIPNLHDLATWLGKDAMNPHIPACRERFGEEFRPVRLQKHVCGYQSTQNDFSFDKVLNGRLIEAITKWSQRKPLMVFCFTRKSCVETAKLLANWWASKAFGDRYWSPPRSPINVTDKDLRETVSSGVAFHHAGLDAQDRTIVEKGYLKGDINVICCTSTLAVGVNLPCHMVIIKGTVTYQGIGCKEYSDLEIMQMLGRAGRPQFDDSAVAVVMTRLQRVQHYEKMITGQELLESTLHLNLTDHLNAEIGLGTITSASSAKRWMTGTFLYVRLKENPEHYKIEGDAPGQSLDERLEQICTKGIALLSTHDLIRSTTKLQCTEFGDAMTRYYVQFDTMKIFLALRPKAKISEILSTISQAAEFHAIRWRANEKPAYKDLNRNSSIKFPIPVNLDAPAHKISLVIQAVLGAIDLPTDDHGVSTEFQSAKAIIFSNVHRLIRCIIDCQLHLEDSTTTRNALMLARSLGAHVWDDSPLHMKQLEGVGIVSVRKLASAGIKSIEDIEAAEAHRLETVLSRNPPYGSQLQAKARTFPRLRVALKVTDSFPFKKDNVVTIKMKAEIGFLNDGIPESFGGKAVYVCLLVETSDGMMLHFARISAKKLNKGQDVLFNARLTSCLQAVRAHVMCDDIAATARQAMLKPDIPVSAFPPPKKDEVTEVQRESETHASNTSKRRTSATRKHSSAKSPDLDDDFGDGDIDDVALAMAEDSAFMDIDDIDLTGDSANEPAKKKRKVAISKAPNVQPQEPRQFANGRWACNHRCTDKTVCKHLCCREGLEKKPKPPKSKSASAKQEQSDPTQSKLDMTVSKKAKKSSNDQQAGVAKPLAKKEPSEVRDLNRLHNSAKTSTSGIVRLGQSSVATAGSGQKPLSFLQAAHTSEEEDFGSFDEDGLDALDRNDLPSAGELINLQPTVDAHRPSGDANLEDDEMLDFDFGDVDYGHVIASRDGHGREPPSHTSDAAQAHADDPNYHSIAVPDTFIPSKDSNLFMSSSADCMDDGRSQGRFRADAAISNNNMVDDIVDLGAHDTAQPEDQPVEVDSFSTDIPEHHGVAESDRPASPDDLEKWFKAEFGTEHFNYCG